MISATDSTSELLHPGFTPLHHAILCKSDNNTIKALLDQGASPAARTPESDTPLHLITLISERYYMARYYMRNGDKAVTPVDDRLFLLEENPFGSKGFSHCHIACMFGKLEIVRSFLDRGLDPNRHRVLGPFRIKARDHLWHGDTCLHVATHAGHSDVVQLLLERGADPNACNASLCTPLHNATYDRQGSATKLLLQYGADVNARNCDDMTPLHVQCSIHFWRRDVMTALLEAGADINLINSAGVTALHDGLTKYGIEGIRSLMMEHAVSLQEAGFYLSDDNIKSIFEVEQSNDMTEYRNDCRCELERMNQVRLDERTTLFDALRIHDPRRLQLLAVDEKFGHIVADEATLGYEYPIYGYLARLQYRRGARITETVLALQKLYAYIPESDKGFPPECAEMVLRYLTWADQTRVIQAVSLCSASR